LFQKNINRKIKNKNKKREMISNPKNQIRIPKELLVKNEEEIENLFSKNKENNRKVKSIWSNFVNNTLYKTLNLGK
jgi:hypothetical protein